MERELKASWTSESISDFKNYHTVSPQAEKDMIEYLSSAVAEEFNNTILKRISEIRLERKERIKKIGKMIDKLDII